MLTYADVCRGHVHNLQKELADLNITLEHQQEKFDLDLHALSVKNTYICVRILLYVCPHTTICVSF